MCGKGGRGRREGNDEKGCGGRATSPFLGDYSWEKKVMQWCVPNLLVVLYSVGMLGYLLVYFHGLSPI